MSIFFFCNDTATTEIYTLSLHDALPIYRVEAAARMTRSVLQTAQRTAILRQTNVIVRFDATNELLTVIEDANNDKDRKSTRLNSSHANISYAVFCLKKKITRVCTLTVNA